MTYCTDVVKASVATLAYLGGAFGSEDDTDPTMEPINEPQNHFYNHSPLFSNFGFDDDTALDDGWYQLNAWSGSWDPLFTNISGSSWDDDGWSLPEFSAVADGE